MRNFLKLILFLVFFNAEAALSSCVRIALIDDAGQVVKPDGLVVAARVGEKNIFFDLLPLHRDRKVVGPINCPASVMQSIYELYNNSCTSERARQQSAVNNNTNKENIRSRCLDLQRTIAGFN